MSKDVIDKFLFIFKPCQSGKTKIMLDKIKELLEDEYNFDNEKKNKIFIVFCDNSLLQTEQLKTRTESENLDSIIMSSKSEVKNVESAYHRIKVKKQYILIMCANSVQIDNINKLIEDLKNDDYKFYIYIDEVDKTFKGKTFENIKNWAKNDKIQKIHMITATFLPITKKFNKEYPNIKSLPILALQNSYDRDKYHRIDDSKLIYIDFDNFELNKILNNYKFNNKTILFCPSAIQKIDHYDTKNVLCKNGFNVLVINSDGSKIFYHNEEYDKNENGFELSIEDRSIDDKNVEMSKWLSKIYHDKNYKLIGKKFAITGNLSIGRGITISSPDLMITDAIIPECLNDLSTGYQLIGRLCGNMKEWPNYSKPTIYCIKSIVDSLICYQNKVIKLAEDAYKDESTLINVNKLKYQDAGEPYGIPIKLEINSVRFKKLMTYIEKVKNGSKKFNPISANKVKTKLGKYIINNKIECINYNQNLKFNSDLNFRNIKIIGSKEEPWDKVKKYPLVEIEGYIQAKYRLKPEERNTQEKGDAIVYILCSNYTNLEANGIYKDSIYITFIKN